jgi:hypothetical protein
MKMWQCSGIFKKSGLNDTISSKEIKQIFNIFNAEIRPNHSEKLPK